MLCVHHGAVLRAVCLVLAMLEVGFALRKWPGDQSGADRRSDRRSIWSGQEIEVEWTGGYIYIDCHGTCFFTFLHRRPEEDRGWQRHRVPTSTALPPPAGRVHVNTGSQARK